MDQAPDNPPENSLHPGINDTDVQAAIASSGYPLQSLVGESLKSHNFLVQDEWGYHDRTTGTNRAIDLLARLDLRQLPSDDSRIRPAVTLIVECKQSDLPYVFFDSKPMAQAQIARMAGLRKDQVIIKTDDDRSTWTYSTLHCLDLHRHPFLAEPPSCASTLSKCVRNQSKLVMSGSDGYLNVVLPLMSALTYYIKVAKPPNTAFWFDARIVVGIAVLDAPMVTVEVDSGTNRMQLSPWVRVHRHETTNRKHFAEWGDLYALDFVHRSYFPTYLSNHLLPFSSSFADLALKHHHELASGTAFVSGMGENFYDEVESRLLPRKRDIGPPARIPPRRKSKPTNRAT